MVVPGIYSQRDARWSNQLLGLNTDPGYNIYHYGCLVTSLANLGWYTGHNLTPEDVNNQLKSRGGFVNGGEVVWSVVPSILPELVTHGTVGILYQANNFVQADGNFAVLQVTKPGFPMHFVVLVDPGRIADPWDGAVKPATSYSFVTAHLFSTKAAQAAQGEDPAVIAELQQQLQDAFKAIDAAKNEAYNNHVQAAAAQEQVAQLTQELNQLKSQASAPTEPANTTTEATPVPVVQKEATHVPIQVEESHDGLVNVVPDTVDQLTVVSTFATQPKVKLDHGAIITDLNSGLDIQRVPIDTVISINRVVKLKDLQYVQTDKLITLNHGISEQYLQMVTPLTDVPVPTAEEVGSLWSKILGLLHKLHR